MCMWFSLLAGRLERWLQLMLRWSPQTRGKDTKQIPKESPIGTEPEEKSKKSKEGSRDNQSGSTTCFEELDQILDLKVQLSSCLVIKKTKLLILLIMTFEISFDVTPKGLYCFVSHISSLSMC